MNMLVACAPPAESVPPTRVASTSQPDGTPRRATNIVGTVVTRRSSMMRGFVRATKAFSRAAGVKGAAGASARVETELSSDTGRRVYARTRTQLKSAQVGQVAAPIDRS